MKDKAGHTIDVGTVVAYTTKNKFGRGLSLGTVTGIEYPNLRLDSISGRDVLRHMGQVVCVYPKGKGNKSHGQYTD